MQLEIGMTLQGKITGITKFGAFVELEPGVSGMVHISEIANTFVKEVSDHVKEGDIVNVMVIGINDDGKISLSIKKTIVVEARPVAPRPSRPIQKRDNYSKPAEPLGFEEMLAKFKQASEEKISDLKRVTNNRRGSGQKKSK